MKSIIPILFVLGVAAAYPSLIHNGWGLLHGGVAVAPTAIAVATPVVAPVVVTPAVHSTAAAGPGGAFASTHTGGLGGVVATSAHVAAPVWGVGHWGHHWGHGW